MRKFSLLLLLTALGAPAQTPSTPQFQDRAKQAGLTVSHISSLEKRYIVESMSGGAGLIDCDNDGKLDIITVNGSTIERFKQRRRSADHSLPSGRKPEIQRHYRFRRPHPQRLGHGRGRR